MRNTDRWIGVGYVFTFTTAIPLIFGGMIWAVWLAAFDGQLPMWFWFSCGLAFSLYIFKRSLPYILKFVPAFVVLHRLPMRAQKLQNPYEHLIARGPGWHWVSFTERPSGQTEHEKDELIVIGEKGAQAVFETFGDDLNLQVIGSTLTLRFPLHLARELRTLGGTMGEIRSVLQKLLRPVFVSAITKVFATKEAKKILSNPLDIAREILREFSDAVDCNNHYGCEAHDVSLGQIDFSVEIAGAREQKKAAKLRRDAARGYMDASGEENGKPIMPFERAMELVLAGEDHGTLEIRKHHISLEGIDPDVAAAAATALGQLAEKKKGKS